jgi:hypothetical protein
VRARGAVVVGVAVLAAGCTAGSPSANAPATTTTSAPAASSSAGEVVGDEQPVLMSSTLTCENEIDGDPPPADYTVVLGAVALPTAPDHPALQAAPAGPDPGAGVFAKTGLLVRTGKAARLDVPSSVDGAVGIGWSGAPSRPSRTFLVPACPDLAGTGWLSFPGGYWADRPMCLPLEVRVGDQVQRVQIGIGTACPGQAAPPTP